MIVIADSGSTKCDWLLMDSSGDEICKQTTLGINPAMFGIEEIKSRLNEAIEILAYANQITHIFFYSAGCGLPSNRKLLHSALNVFFPEVEIEVQCDLVAAVRAIGLRLEPGVVCILGTGSNSCYYDGFKIRFAFDSLGHSVMDEASGSYFGKQLLRDYFYKKMPSELALRFEENFEVETEKILLHLYKKPMPAQFLASYAKFIFDIGVREPYIQNLLKKGFEELVEFQLQIWQELSEHPIHFIGSIAYFAEDILREVLELKKISVGKVIQTPIQELMNYHLIN